MTIQQKLYGKRLRYGALTSPPESFAKKMDAEDPLRHLRDQFHYPKSIDLPEGETQHMQYH